jgi:tetratricopeptide (TPR) repeat protein
LTDFQAGNVALVEGRCEDAVVMYERHARSHEKDAARCYTKMAEAYRRSNVLEVPIKDLSGMQIVFEPNLAGAERSLRRALSIDPDYFPALAALGDLLVHAVDERRRVLERAATLREDLRVLLHLARTYEELEDPGLAHQTYLRAQQHAPLDGTAYEGLQRVCGALGNDSEAALWAERWKEAHEKKPRVDGQGRSPNFAGDRPAPGGSRENNNN